MSDARIVWKTFQTIIAVVVALVIWSWAGSLVSSPDDMSVMVGWVIYAALVAGVVGLIVHFVRKFRK